MAEVVLNDLTVGIFDTPSGGGANRPPSGVSQRGPMSIEEARSRSTFNVGLPATLPTGFKAFDALMLEGEFQLTLLAFGSDSGRLTLVQGPTSQYQAGKDGVRRYFVHGRTLQETTVDGVPAALAEVPARRTDEPPSYTLVWERDGVLNQLLGHNVVPTDLTATAASIR